MNGCQISTTVKRINQPLIAGRDPFPSLLERLGEQTVLNAERIHESHS